VPEVTQVVSRIGSPAVATDIMGLEQADVFVALKPRPSWRPGLSREALIAQIESGAGQHAPGGEPSFTQPIQMRFNEILAGAVSDVVVSILRRRSRRAATAGRAGRAKAVPAEPGAEDVKVLAPPKSQLLRGPPAAA
jgi:cobalt-zinc-cadmium resistance protein CzcA